MQMGAAADTDFDKVRACLSEEEEAVAVDYVSGADLDAVAVFSRMKSIVCFCQQV